jgi:hypothetical protein
MSCRTGAATEVSFFCVEIIKYKIGGARFVVFRDVTLAGRVVPDVS